jgi:hypothetical protein
MPEFMASWPNIWPDTLGVRLQVSQEISAALKNDGMPG